MTRINLAVNRYAFHWAYPEILADESGLFKKHGLSVDWHDVTPLGVTNKSAMYTDLLEEGRTDFYHAGEWACINRVLKSPGSCIVAKSRPGRGTLNSTFSLYVTKESGLRRPEQLADRPVAIEEGTGSYFSTLLDLEKHLPPGSIRLVQVGEPHRRLLSLMNGGVDAASLVGPWADIGMAVGLRRILRTRRTNPTTTVVRRETSVEVARAFFRSVNEAIIRIDRNPSRYRASYFKRVEGIILEMPPPVSRLRRLLARKVTVSRWNAWERYSSLDFQRTYTWMTRRDLAPTGHTAGEVVAYYSAEVFS